MNKGIPADPLREAGLTAKEAWWAGARAGLGIDPETPRDIVARLLSEKRSCTNGTPITSPAPLAAVEIGDTQTPDGGSAEREGRDWSTPAGNSHSAALVAKPESEALLQQRVYAWLGRNRDVIPMRAVEALQDVLGPLEAKGAPAAIGAEPPDVDKAWKDGFVKGHAMASEIRDIGEALDLATKPAEPDDDLPAGWGRTMYHGKQDHPTESAGKSPIAEPALTDEQIEAVAEQISWGRFPVERQALKDFARAIAALAHRSTPVLAR